MPLLVLQGDRDKTVPRAQAEALVDAVRRAGYAAAYGREWFRRTGGPALLDILL